MNKRFHLFLILFFLFSTQANGQEETHNPTLTFGYIGHLGYHPGASIGLKLDLKQWKKKKSNTLYIHPKLGYYVWPGYNSSYFIGSDIGIQRSKSDKNLWHSYSLGAGYVLKTEIISTTVNLQGDIVDRNRENRHEIMALFSYKLGSSFNSQWGWYSGLSFGYKNTFKVTGSITAYAEAGITYQLNVTK